MGERKRRRRDGKGTRWGGITMGFSLPKVIFCYVAGKDAVFICFMYRKVEGR